MRLVDTALGAAAVCTASLACLPVGDDEITVDLFAGGGGASEGIKQATGRDPDIAVNHDWEAVALHLANHPRTVHYLKDVFKVDPRTVCNGRPVGLLWASPDCKHFSKAKGAAPVSKRTRDLAWVVIEWARLVAPRVIILENVEEFQTWGPLGADGRPCKIRKGTTFRAWRRRLVHLGYQVELREIAADTLGTPTIRNRLYVIARRDGAPIVWPQATHGDPASAQVKAGQLKPWHTAADCIDWSLPCHSIFLTKEEGRAVGVNRPLVDATMRRIAKGVMRYVVDAPEPFIVPLTHQGGERTESAREPFRVITGANRGEKALVVPLITQHANASAPRSNAANEPLRTQCAEIKGGHFALVAAFLAKHYGGVVGSDVRRGVGTVTAVDHHSVVAANLVHMGHGEGADGSARFSHGVRTVQQPLNTITASGATAGIVASHLVKLRGTNVGSATSEPVHTISAQGMHHAEVRAFLVKYYGADQDPRLDEPLHTATSKARFGIVTVHGEPYAIADIGMRMFAPRELYRAQGFPEDYVIHQVPDIRKTLLQGHGVTLAQARADWIALTKTAQIRMCGNSVCPPVARALVAANYVARRRVLEAA